MNIRNATMLAALLMPLWIAEVMAQICVPPSYSEHWYDCWSLKSRDVEAVIRDQVASVTVTDEVVNPCSQVNEVEYLLPLPPDAAIDALTLVMNGREITGRVLDAREARQVYEDIVRRQRDPGLLEYAGYGLYRSSAFPLSPGGTARLIVHYTVTCRKDVDLVEFWYPMTTGRFGAEPIGHFSIRCDIESAAAITTVYSPTVEIKVQHKTPNRAIASHETGGYRPQSDFQLFYEASREQVGASFMTYWPDGKEDGYYLLLVSPSPRLEDSKPLAKDVVIVLDRSGSMQGEKIQQAREAARYVINNLNAADRFDLIDYSDYPEACFESLQPVTKETTKLALARVDMLDARGSTNIYKSLEMAMGLCAQASIERPSYVIYLTDGLPTTGITDERAIIENTKSANRGGARLFAFGVGYDVNVRLLDRLVEENQGRSVYVKPNESIEGKVASLYNRIKNPFMTDVQASLESFKTRQDCPAELGDLFEGDQILRAGRIYSPSGDEGTWTRLIVSGKIAGAEHRFEYPVPLDRGRRSSPNRFVEKLWAVRRVGQLLDDIQLHGKAHELVDELVWLSKKYGIITPYTSFLAEEGRNLSDNASLRMEATEQVQSMTESITGPDAQMGAAMRKQAADMVAVPQASAGGFALKVGTSSQEAYESGRSEEISTIRIVGSETLYKRGDTWQSSNCLDLDLNKDRGTFVTVQRYSEEYFCLIAENSVEENRVFAAQKTDEKLLISLRGSVYLIE